MKDKSHTIISKDAEKYLAQHPSSLAVEGHFLNLIKAFCDKPTANVILNGERLNAFPLRSGKRYDVYFSPLLFNIILEVLSRTFRPKRNKKEKSKERHLDWKISKIISIYR